MVQIKIAPTDSENPMRFLCLYKPAKSEDIPPTQQEMADMGKLIEESMKSGELLATEGCLPSARGSRVRLSEGKFKVIGGPSRSQRIWLAALR
jgi:hypothetical protein